MENLADFTYLEEALKKITGVLNALMARVERVEEELIKQCRQVTPSSSNDVTPQRPGKVLVPLAVRVSTTLQVCSYFEDVWGVGGGGGGRICERRWAAGSFTL